MKLVTRAQWGGPTSIGTATPVRVGMAVHYNGPATGLTASSDHARCTAYWKGIHNFHKNTNGWAGIGYAWGVCPHGWVYEGRGHDRTQAAQPGGNSSHQSVQFMLGGSERPSAGMVQAWRDLRAYLRAKGVGAVVRPHSSWNATSCPGDYLRSLIADGTLTRADTAPAPAPGGTVNLANLVFDARNRDVETYQRALAAKGHTVFVDGWFYNQTKAATTAFQLSLGLSGAGANGLPGRYTVTKLGLTPSTAAPPPPATDGEPAHVYTRVTYGGKTVNARTRQMLKNAVELLTAYEWAPVLTQGSYNRGVSASAGTHDGGGVVDIRTSTMTRNGQEICVQALRKAGFFAWLRTPAQGFSYHIHAVAIGDRELSASAKSQVVQGFQDRNGLAGRGPDPDSDPYPDWTRKYGTHVSPD